MSTPKPSLTHCSIARTLDIVGEKWTLLIVRDIARGMTRFSDIHHSLGCPKNLLSTRLRTLEKAGILQRTAYQETGARTRWAYHFTESGSALVPLLLALHHWGQTYLDAVPQQVPPPACPQCDGELQLQILCSNGHLYR
ncbi:MAG: helix-turn-helix domain-containing protein [Actinomycetaceae bacterium]|nr:helix-turn-helix domain-containing protein [Actinomycetaceae bacterium]